MAGSFDPVLVAFAVEDAGVVAVGAVEAEGFGEEDVALLGESGLLFLEFFDFVS